MRSGLAEITLTRRGRDGRDHRHLDAVSIAEIKSRLRELRRLDRVQDRRLQRHHPESAVAHQVRAEKQRIALEVRRLTTEALAAPWR